MKKFLLSSLFLLPGLVFAAGSASHSSNPAISPAPTPVELSKHIQTSLAGMFPAAAQYATPVFSNIDAARVRAAQALDSGTIWIQGQSNFAMAATISLYILSGARYVVSNASIFYGILVISFLLLVWKLFHRNRAQQ